MTYRRLFSKFDPLLLFVGWLIFVGLVFPLMHGSLIQHLFVAIPAVMSFGFAIGKYLLKEPPLLAKWNRSGIPGILLANLTFIFWMIPRFLDESIQHADIYVYKIISLTFFCGLPLAWSLNKASYITFNFFRIEFIATLFRMAWLFMTAKDRLCVNYLFSEQALVGELFFLLAIIYSLWPAVKVVFGQHKECISINKT